MEVANETARRGKPKQPLTRTAKLETRLASWMSPTRTTRRCWSSPLRAKLAGTSDDENAMAWAASSDRNQYDTIEGNWSSRWNGGADPTIPGDAANKWKQGQAEVKPQTTVSISCSTGIMESAEGSLTHSAKTQQSWLESISI